MNFKRKVTSVICTVFIGLFLIAGIHAAGDVDTSFNGSAQYAANGPVYDTFKQTDGKIIIAGNFTAVNGYAANSVARLNADGTLDSTFNAPDYLKLSSIYAVAVQTDGKVIVGVSYTLLRGIRRLNADGSDDTSFTPINFDTTFTSIIYDIEILPDGKFLVGGIFPALQQTDGNLFRYNSDGTRDNTFGTNFTGAVKEIELLSDGRILIGGYYSTGGQGYLVRLASGGAIDATFGIVGTTSSVETLRVQTDGKIIFGGTFTSVNGDDQRGISRVNGDGTMDPTFNPSNNGTNGSVYAITVRPDGKILIGGDFSLYNGVSKNDLALIENDGTLDNSFTANLGNSGQVETIDLTQNSKILIGYSGNIFQKSGLVRLNSDGTTDSSITYYVSKLANVRKVLEQPDGKILLAGDFDVVNNTPRPGIARLNADGSLDATFNPTIPNQNVRAVALQADGKILIGTYAGLVLKRLNPDGSLDNTFATATLIGEVNDIAVLPNGEILTAGWLGVGSSGSRAGVRKFNADGSATSFAFSNSTFYKVYPLPSGKILVGGQGLYRLNSDGTADGTFASSINIFIADLDVQSDGKIVVVGSFNALNGNTSQKNIGRITSEGFSDPSFTQQTDGQLLGVKIQPDGKILVAGAMAFVSGVHKQGLVRLNPDSSIDSSFTANANSPVFDVILLNGGKILVGGEFTRINNVSKVSVARLNNNVIVPRAAFDFDGDGRTDIGVFRPSNSVWYQLLGPNYQFSSANFGTTGDLLAPADYDGDGRTDLGIFRPSTGTFWYAASSQGGAFRAVQWGQLGDVPLPSDINGDGKDDFVVYRPSNNTWYRLTDTGEFSSLVFGSAGDKPLIGDFDGDGKSDYAIFRPSTGTWWYAASSLGNAFRAVQWGANGDAVVPADYDGDGTTDMAVYRPSTGVWYILNSSNQTATIIQFGLSADKPVAGDYDGDGKADIAVYRPSTGEWYILRSTAGFFGLQFGIAEDIPVPYAFIQ